MSYKTPGVYVKEISLLPPSVAQVETAIPAFIGYTEMAADENAASLLNVPTRIKSMLEYREFYGGAIIQDLQVALNTDVPYTPESVGFDGPESPFRMYHALEMYFYNGGGPCYILSVGDYDSANATPSLDSVDDFDELKAGLDAIRKIDEVTLIVIPEADRLGSPQMYDLYKEVLMQCADLKDRFGIFDVLNSDNEAEEFRNNIGTNNLMYGAAYFPYLNTALVQPYASEKVKFSHAGSPFHNLIMADLDVLAAAAGHDAEVVKAKNAADLAVVEAAGKEKKVMIGHLKSAMTAADKGLRHSEDSLKLVEDESFVTTELGDGSTKLTEVKDDNIDINDTAVDIQAAIVKLADACSDFVTASSAILTQINTETGIDPSDNAEIAQYYTNGFVTEVQALLNGFKITMPPSSSAAGVYARVDSARGVWKSPANESVNMVNGPSVKIDNFDNDNFNVHGTGKSINVIRSFTGRGTLIWGARTLDGNSGEWKYVSVRRFFNMVEESIKKASERFVFEPNDANTWVKVKAMIENFLVLQWRAGALMGAKADEAFFVHVGLGETMTADDVLNGRMIIEIGLAAVRPAEFIILRFSHKMMEA